MTPGAHLGTVTLRGRPFRLYAAMHGEADHPWTLAGDLAAFAEMDEAQEAEWLATITRHFPEVVDHLPDGSPIVAESVVSGLFQVWLEQGYSGGQKLLDEWWDGWMDIFAAHHTHLPWDEWLRVLQVAGLRNMPRITGVTVVQ